MSFKGTFKRVPSSRLANIVILSFELKCTNMMFGETVDVGLFPSDGSQPWYFRDLKFKAGQTYVFNLDTVNWEWFQGDYAAILGKDNKIIENQKTISSLESEVEKLKKYKDIVDKEEAEKEEAEKNRKIEELKTIAKTGGYISEKEISEDETIKKMISELDETGIKSLIVDRMLVKDKETSSNHTSEMSEYHTDIIDDDNKVSAFDVFMGSK